MSSRLVPSIVGLIFVLLFGCSSRSTDDLYEEGQGIIRTLVEELKAIHTRDQLLAEAPKLKKLFNSLVDVIIAAHKYQGDNSFAEKDHLLSDSLHHELERVYRIEGGRDIIEKSQEEALNRLDAAVKKSN